MKEEEAAEGRIFCLVWQKIHFQWCRVVPMWHLDWHLRIDYSMISRYVYRRFDDCQVLILWLQAARNA